MYRCEPIVWFTNADDGTTMGIRRDHITAVESADGITIIRRDGDLLLPVPISESVEDVRAIMAAVLTDVRVNCKDMLPGNATSEGVVPEDA